MLMRIQHLFCLLLVFGGGRSTKALLFSLLSLRTTSRVGSNTQISRMATPSSSTVEWKVVPSIRYIVDDYDVFLLDMWGVMHDGVEAYEGVLDVVQQLQQEKKLIILSNSSKRQENAVKMLIQLGFDPTVFSKIITSGEIAFQLLRHLSSSSQTRDTQSSSWIPSSIPKPLQDIRAATTSRKAFCFGSGDGDKEYLESCGWFLADSISQADLIVARGTFVIQDAYTTIHKMTDGEEAYFEAYYQVLKQASDKQIPMIVCNPDKIRPDADKSPMPGTIGVTYEEMLAKKGADNDLVLYLGKPFADVYEIALQDYPGKRACMVGDALETDVAGAQAAGIDSFWVVKNGIHNDEVAGISNFNDHFDDNELLRAGCHKVIKEFNQRSEATYAKGRQLSPTVVLPYFRW
jgi:ribonucleotide monophosphatase NagD (HAD superfamily)